MYKLLIAEDDSDIREIYSDFFSMQFDVTAVENGKLALDACAKENYDFVILDIAMPVMDGYEACKKILERYPDMLILMLTSTHTEETDQLKGYRNGAISYRIKGTPLQVLMVEVIRLIQQFHQQKEKSSLEISGITVNTRTRLVCVEEKPINLTTKEFNLLEYLMSNQGISLSRKQILNAVWSDDDFVLERVVDTQVASLRRKLGNKKECIETIHGFGYKFNELS